MYKIETRTKDGWSDHVGEGNAFASAAEAEQAIEDLRALGAEWAEAEYRVVEANHRDAGRPWSCTPYVLNEWEYPSLRRRD